MTVSEQSPLLDPARDQNNTDATAPRQKDTRSDKLIVWATFIGVLIASADESLVISTYSAIASQFHRLSDGSWLLLAYNFGYCISLPVYSGLGDTYGRKNVLIWSYVFFAISCILCGASQNIIQLVLSRILSGSSGAGMIVVVSVILTDLIPAEELALYRGYQNVVNVAGRSLGGPIGGLLADTIGWRWAFYGQFPIIGLCTVFVLCRLPASLNEVEREDAVDSSGKKRSPMRDLDFVGLIVLSGTILSLLFLLQGLGRTDTDALQLGLLGGAIGLGCIIFTLIELFWAKKPLVPMRLMCQTIAAYWLVQVLILAGRFALATTYSPYFLRVEGSTDLIASLPVVLTAIGLSVGGVVAGLVIKRTKHYKPMTQLATLTILTVYILTLFQWRHGFPTWHVIPLFLGGFATGILFPTLFVGMAACAPEGQLHTCIGAYYLSQQLGLIIGPAVAAAMGQRFFEGNLQHDLQGLKGKQEIIHRILNEVRFARTLPGRVQGIVRECYLKAFQSIPLFSIATTVIIIPIVFALKEQEVGH